MQCKSSTCFEDQRSIDMRVHTSPMSMIMAWNVKTPCAWFIEVEGVVDKKRF